MPASTSSKIRPGATPLGGRSAASVHPARDVAVSDLIASISRDSSPPETMRASGRSSSPGFGDTIEFGGVDSARRPGVLGQRFAEPDLEARSLHRQVGRQFLHAARERGRDATPLGRERLALPPGTRAATRPARGRARPAAGRRLRGPPVRAATRRAGRCTSASVGPYLRFRRSSSARRSSTCCSLAGDASMPSAYRRRNSARSSSCDLMPSRASRYG